MLVKSRQSAQVGMTTVLLSIILLYIAVSVTWRVVRQTQEELSRTESSQAYNRAESLAGVEGLGTQKEDGATGNEAVSLMNAQNDMLFVKKGETITLDLGGDDDKIPLCSLTSRTTCRDDYQVGKLPYIYYNSGTKLLVRKIRTITNNSTGNVTTTTTQEYSGTAGSSVVHASCPTTPTDAAQFCNNNGFNNYLSSELQFCRKVGSTECTASTSGASCPAGSTCKDIAVIMVLDADTYLGMQGLARHYRSASYNATGSEVRVVEQSETDPSAPGMFQFSILVNGTIN